MAGGNSIVKSSGKFGLASNGKAIISSASGSKDCCCGNCRCANVWSDIATYTPVATYDPTFLTGKWGQRVAVADPSTLSGEYRFVAVGTYIIHYRNTVTGATQTIEQAYFSGTYRYKRTNYLLGEQDYGEKFDGYFGGVFCVKGGITGEWWIRLGPLPVLGVHDTITSIDLNGFQVKLQKSSNWCSCVTPCATNAEIDVYDLYQAPACFDGLTNTYIRMIVAAQTITLTPTGSDMWCPYTGSFTATHRGGSGDTSMTVNVALKWGSVDEFVYPQWEHLPPKITQYIEYSSSTTIPGSCNASYYWGWIAGEHNDSDMIGFAPPPILGLGEPLISPPRFSYDRTKCTCNCSSLSVTPWSYDITGYPGATVDTTPIALTETGTTGNLCDGKFASSLDPAKPRTGAYDPAFKRYEGENSGVRALVFYEPSGARWVLALILKGTDPDGYMIWYGDTVPFSACDGCYSSEAFIQSGQPTSLNVACAGCDCATATGLTVTIPAMTFDCPPDFPDNAASIDVTVTPASVTPCADGFSGSATETGVLLPKGDTGDVEYVVSVYPSGSDWYVNVDINWTDIDTGPTTGSMVWGPISNPCGSFAYNSGMGTGGCPGETYDDVTVNA